jgi:hypothetical protein
LRGTAEAVSAAATAAAPAALPAPTADCPATRAVDVLCSLMNAVVVSASSADCESASEKFFHGYLALLRLLRQLGGAFPAAAAYAEARLAHFQAAEAHRSKDAVVGCPDLGVLLVLRLLVPQQRQLPWAGGFGEAFYAEAAIRNVRWYLQDHPQLAFRGAAQRLPLTFQAIAVSRRVVCFQVRCAALCQAVELAGFVDGAAPGGLLASLKAAHGEVARLGGWGAYRAFLGLPPLSDAAVEAGLEDNVRCSREKGYHR